MFPAAVDQLLRRCFLTVSILQYRLYYLKRQIMPVAVFLSFSFRFLPFPVFPFLSWLLFLIASERKTTLSISFAGGQDPVVSIPSKTETYRGRWEQMFVDKLLIH